MMLTGAAKYEWAFENLLLGSPTGMLQLQKLMQNQTNSAICGGAYKCTFNQSSLRFMCFEHEQD